MLRLDDVVEVVFENARRDGDVVARYAGNFIFPSRMDWEDPGPKAGEKWKVRLVWQGRGGQERIYRAAPVERIMEKRRTERQGKPRPKEIPVPTAPFPVVFVEGKQRPIARFGHVTCVPSRDWRNTHDLPQPGEIFMVEVVHLPRGQASTWVIMPVRRLGRYPDADTARATAERSDIRAVIFLRPRNWEQSHGYSAVANLDGRCAYPDRDRWGGWHAPQEGEVWLVSVVREAARECWIRGIAQVFDRTFAALFGSLARDYPPVEST